MTTDPDDLLRGLSPAHLRDLEDRRLRRLAALEKLEAAALKLSKARLLKSLANAWAEMDEVDRALNEAMRVRT